MLVGIHYAWVLISLLWPDQFFLCHWVGRKKGSSLAQIPLLVLKTG